MYAINFTRFEKHSWFSLQPAVQATHDNQLCFVKTDHAFVHLHCSTQSIMKKVLPFHLVLALHLHQYRIGHVKQKTVELYKTLYLRWCAFCLRNMDERFHHLFTCVVTAQRIAEKPGLLQNLSRMWSKWWHLHRKESFAVTVSGSGVLYPPVTGCNMAYRLSNTLPALRFQHWKFITESKTFYVIFIFSSIFVF